MKKLYENRDTMNNGYWRETLILVSFIVWLTVEKGSVPFFFRNWGGGGEGEISKPKALRDIIEAYYKQLFGKEERGQISLQSDIWENEDSMLELGNRQFDRVFFLKRKLRRL
jgi:hypothetical protein